MAEENEDSVITTVRSEEEEQAEALAFAASFNAERGVESKPEPDTPAAEPEPAAAETPEAPAPAGTETPGTPAPAGTETPGAEPEPQKLIAGLTEEQIAAALSRTGALQSTVDKMAGRLGSLMQQIEALKANPPTTQVAQQALDLKLEKLSAQFPELANLLREDLSTLQQAQAASPAPAVPSGLTQEQFDVALNARLAGATEQLTEQMEAKILTIQHPDWLEIIKTPQFALFRDNVLPPGVGQQLMSSSDSTFISAKLTEFKEWRAKSQAPAPAKPAIPPARQSRLAQAVIPNGDRSAPKAPQTEEDAFIAGFKNARAAAGY